MYLQNLIENFFMLGDVPSNAEVGTYSLLLIILSYGVACLGCYTGLLMAERIIRAKTLPERKLFHLGGALAFGSGIWSMHFIGMLALNMDMEISYNPYLTALSMSIAVFVADRLLRILSLARLSLKGILIGAFYWGAAICAMHYTGMAAMQMDASLFYKPVPFFLSCVIAVFASGATFCIVFILGHYKHKGAILWRTIASLVMGAGVCGTHFTGMAAAVIIPYANCRHGVGHDFGHLAIIVAVVTSIIFGLCLAGTLYGKEQKAFSDSEGMHEFPFRLVGLSFVLVVAFIAWNGFFTLKNYKGGVHYFEQKSENANLYEEMSDLNNRMVLDIRNYFVSRDSKWKDTYKMDATLMVNVIAKSRNGTFSNRGDRAILADNVYLNWAALDRKGFEYADLTPSSKGENPLESDVYEDLANSHSEAILGLKNNLFQSSIGNVEEIIKFNYYSMFVSLFIAVALLVVWVFTIRNFRWWKKEFELSKREQKNKAIFLDTLLNQMPTAIFAKNIKDDFRIILANDCAGKMFDVKKEDMIGKTDYDLWPKAEADFFRATDEGVMKGRAVVDIPSEPVTTPSGTFIAHTIKIPIYDALGEPSILLGIIEDVSAKAKTEEALRDAKQAAEEASLIKSNFLANMSHEIRTPMNAVLGMSGLLLDTKLSDEQKDWVNAISSSGETLMELINDIIDISKIEAGKLSLEEAIFDLPKTLEELSVLYAYKAREKGIELILDIDKNIPCNFIGDQVRIKQVFVNLISNAMKFAHKGHILIKIERVVNEDDFSNIYCSVTDTGIGVAKDKQRIIFEKFSQAEQSTTRQFGGAGLGLAIVSEILELMGGKIRIDSKKGQGSTFSFNFKLQKCVQPENLSIIEVVKPITALIVDDYDLTRHTLESLLVSEGICCKAVSNAEKAYDILAKGDVKYDVCLIDHALGGMDGLSLIKKIRTDKSKDFMALIMVSGTLPNKANSELKYDGVDGYFKKPFIRGDLIGGIYLAVQDKRFNKDVPLITRHTIMNMARSELAHNRRTTRVMYTDKRILVVEDMNMNMMLIKKVLSKFGIVPDTAVDGLEAFEKMKKNDYDLVFMDCQMPVMDGFEVTRKIRDPEADYKNSLVPIVAITANAMMGDKEKCLQAGMNDYINKPFKEAEIAKVLEKWL